ncbi:LOW QUALITY PROTEIN: lisH domain-containing protein ARMC9-like protein [Cinnamomum micranthum f. kanehirae]|uniref:LisH domain-containing protein ARMC9-like protein n=1 Tax=Cinnamomum micranthum f. kanehirae TaxID=337451 RepID=A0A443PNJ6_9MAGN|nr:LOW QUALITY PROTEIN: lisH domain-containing protein ARMC9-like protein [Cinnamomum micranthum f. kanehirae]
MPLYDCMLLLKPHVEKAALMDLVTRAGMFIEGMVSLTDMKSSGKIYLGYGIKKLGGRYYQGQLMQMTMMITPNFNKELHYLNKEDRLLRWLLVKHRDKKYGLEFISENDAKGELIKIPRSSFYNEEEEEDEDDEEEEYEEETKE